MTANVLILSAAGMLVSAYLMVGQKALFTTIRLYGLQSLLLAIVAITIAISESHRELLVTAALTIVLKTILIPWFLMRTVDRIGIHREIEPFLNVPVSLLICVGLTVVGYRVSTGFEEGSQLVTHHLIGVALSLLLIGLFLMVTRKKAITQILALLTVENAVFLVAHPEEPRESPALRFLSGADKDLRGGGVLRAVLIPGAPDGYVIVRKAVTLKKLKVAQVEKVKKAKK